MNDLIRGSLFGLVFSTIIIGLCVAVILLLGACKHPNYGAPCLKHIYVTNTNVYKCVEHAQ